MMLRFFLALAAVAIVGISPGCTRGEGLDRTKLPENVRADYDVFAQKCSKCHSLARPLSSNITDDEQWSLYVNRMRRQPGSGISPDDQVVILRFLRYYAADLRRIQLEKNGAPAPQTVPVLAPTPAPAPVPAAPTAPAPSALDGGTNG